MILRTTRSLKFINTVRVDLNSRMRSYVLVEYRGIHVEVTTEYHYDRILLGYTCSIKTGNSPFLSDDRCWIKKLKISASTSTCTLTIVFFEPIDLKPFLSQFQSIRKAILIKNSPRLGQEISDGFFL